MIRILAGFAVLVWCMPSHAQESGTARRLEREVYLRLLTDDSALVSIMGARSISLYFPRDTELFDVMAELLLLGQTQTSNHKQALAWYARTLGESRDSRYFETLTAVRPKHSLGVLEAIDSALRNLTPATNGVSYRAGQVDLAALKAARPVPSKLNRDQFAKVSMGTSLVAALQTLGAPDQLSIAILQVKRNAREDQLVAHYWNAGAVVFKLLPGDSRHWVATVVAPQLVPAPAGLDNSKLPVAQMLASLRGDVFLNYVIWQDDRLERDASLRALVLERLKTIPKPIDREEDQGSALALRLTHDKGYAGDPVLLQDVGALYAGKITQGEVDDLVKKLQREPRKRR